MPNKKSNNKKKKSYWASKHPNRYIFMRASVAKIGVHNGKITPLKTAVAVDAGKIKLKKSAGKHNKILKLNAVEQDGTPPPSHRPLVEIKYGPTGSPETGITPNGSQLPRYYSNGAMHFFNNLTDHSPYSNKYVITSVDAAHPFLQSDEYALIKKHFSATKEQLIHITEARVKSAEAAFRKNQSKRKKLQNPTMAVSGKSKEGSANHYFQELVLDVTLNAEWLHLLLYSIAGEQGQIPENLACGTAYANTDMIPIENMLKRLTKLYPEGIHLKIKAGFVKINNDNENEHLQVGTHIEYIISTEDFEIPFSFNAQNKRQPHITNQYYVDELFKTMLTAAELKTPTKKFNASRALFFFEKPEEAAASPASQKPQPDKRKKPGSNK